MSAVGTDYGKESSTVYQRQQAEKEQSKSGKISHGDFLKLLTTQLANQDPLSPMEDIDFTAQLAQLQALDEQMAMTKALTAMRVDTQLQAGTGMIGRYVSGVDTLGEPATGLVTRVVQNSDGVFAELANKQRILVSDVSNMWNDANSMWNDIGSSGNLIDKWVEAGVDESGQPIRGIVEKVLVDNGELKLKLYGGQTVAMSQVTELREPTQSEIWHYLPDEIRAKVEEANAMVGLTITGKDKQGNDVTGIVASADLEGTTVVLTLFGGQKLTLESVTEKPRNPTPEELDSALKGYWVEGLDEKGADTKGIVVGAGEDDSGLYLVLDNGKKVYLDVMEELREAEDKDKGHMIGMWVDGTGGDESEISGIVVKIVEVDGEKAFELSNGMIIRAKDITNTRKPTEDEKNAAGLGEKAA